MSRAGRRTSNCETRDRLEATLAAASRLHSSAARELATNLSTLTAHERTILNEQMATALSDLARARITLKMHQREHGC
jgi:hypothetical protein